MGHAMVGAMSGGGGGGGEEVAEAQPSQYM